MTDSFPPGGRRDDGPPTDDQPTDDQPPDRLVGGRYRLVRRIGRGGMAVVWQGRDEILNRDVAVKEVLPPRDLSPERREEIRRRAMREARAAARLTHPSVVTVYDVVEDGGRPWIVMALLTSRTLADVLASSGPLTPAAAARLGEQLLDALRTAHAAGVLHRDVKPSNVMIADDGRAVLTDFGIATVEEDPSITATGMLVGSPGYMAPERARGERPAPASDLWSLGATLYAATEGEAPFQREGQLATLHAVVSQDAPPAVHAGPLQPIIAGLLERDPARRPGADEAYEQLRRIAAGLPGMIGTAADGPDGAAAGSSQAPTEVIGASAVTSTRRLPLGAVPPGAEVSSRGPDAGAPYRSPGPQGAWADGERGAPWRPAGGGPASRGSGRGVFIALAVLVVIAAAVVVFLLVRLASGGGTPTPTPTPTTPASTSATSSAPSTRSRPAATTSTATSSTSTTSPTQTSSAAETTTSPSPSDSGSSGSPPSSPSSAPGSGGGPSDSTSTG